MREFDLKGYETCHLTLPEPPLYRYNIKIFLPSIMLMYCCFILFFPLLQLHGLLLVSAVSVSKVSVSFFRVADCFVNMCSLLHLVLLWSLVLSLIKLDDMFTIPRFFLFLDIYNICYYELFLLSSEASEDEHMCINVYTI